MRKGLSHWIALLAVSGLLVLNGCAGRPQPAALDPGIMEALNDSLLEVVVPKPEEKAITYAKPLPMHLLPFAVRNDAYYPVGTAFAIAPDRFVTASHVMNMGTRSQFKEVFLRDQKGNVYPIDQIFKFSDTRDFVLFSLKGKKVSRLLAANTDPAENDRVYAVGNALGQGIVIRDGLYTSNTPEELEGEWKWIRFSAAASPGNSGGPLLDRQGRVIGLIVRKSENENLNYALPIREILQAPENTAIVHKRMKYFLDNMDMEKWGTLDRRIPLPKTYDALNGELITAIETFSAQLLKELLEENRGEIFPNGEGSTLLLHNTFNAVFPNLIMKREDGTWTLYGPEKTTDSDLGHNGRLSYGGLGSSLFVRVEKPENIPLEKFLNDSKLFMDTFLQGIYSSREIASDKVKIVSLGKATEESTYIDAYRRKWLVKVYPMEYNDCEVVTFSLPVPGGCVTMLRTAQTGEIEAGHIPDLKALADFVYVTYYGTLAQWRELLAMKSLLPDAFANLDISFDYGKEFRYRSKRLAFSYGPELMKIDATSDLQLGFTFFSEKGKTVWDVGSVMVGDDRNNGNFFRVSRNIRPPESMHDDYRQDWENLVNRRFPYDGIAFFKDKSTHIGATLPESLPEEELSHRQLLYDVMGGMDGNVEQAKLEKKFRLFQANLRLLEE